MTNKRKKVLFFLPSSTGGAERMTVTIAKMLDLEQYEVKFVIVHPTLGTIIDFIPKNYEIIHIPIHNIWFSLTTLRMAHIIQKEKADIVFSSISFLNPRTICAAKITRVKVIVRDSFNILAQNITTRIMMKAFYPMANTIIAQQDEMRMELLKIINRLQKERVVVLQNPIDYTTINEKTKEIKNPFPNDSSINYVWVGRFSKMKAQDILVKALKILLEKIPNAHVYFIGKYDFKKDYDYSVKKYVDNNNLAHNVHFIGFDTNPYRWVRFCDCFVMPSRAEGLPNALIEAMYLKRPVVASKCLPIIERMIDEKHNGYKVPVENPELMAKAMAKAILLKDCKMTYAPATKEDFVKIFESVTIKEKRNK